MGRKPYPKAMTSALVGLTVVTVALNVPGPLAAASLRDDGAKVIKVEPPTGDPLAQMAPAWYAELHSGVEVRTLNLKEGTGQEEMQQLLAQADLFLSSSRPSALSRLGLGPQDLGDAYPRLCRVTIVGDTREPEVPGHDLTYQVEAGLLDPKNPSMPRTLLADVLGSREAYAAALAMLVGRERGATERERVVGLGDSARFATLPLRHGLTAPGGLLSGAQNTYALFRTADGWVAAAPLEAHFAARWHEWLGQDTATELTKQPTAYWVAAAAARDLPLVAVE